MKALLSALLLTFGLSALAHPVGTWVGDLAYTSTDGDDEVWDCEISLARETGKLVVSDLDGCLYTSDYITEYEVRGNQILERGAVVGSFTDTQVTFSDDSGGLQWNLSMTLTADGKLEVKDALVAPDMNYSDLTSGVLEPGKTGTGAARSLSSGRKK